MQKHHHFRHLAGMIGLFLGLLPSLVQATQMRPATALSTMTEQNQTNHVERVQFRMSSAYTSVLDEYATPFYSLGLGAHLQLSTLPNWDLSLAGSFIEPSASYVPDPALYGLQDIHLRAAQSRPTSPGSPASVHRSVGFTFPSSERSNRAGLITSAQLGLGGGYRLNSLFSFTVDSNLILSRHRYETADVFGFSRNSPFSAVVGAGISIQPSSWLNLGLGYSQTHRMDYENFWNQIEGLNATGRLRLGRDVALQFRYGWRDSFYTNDPIFHLAKSDFQTALVVTY